MYALHLSKCTRLILSTEFPSLIVQATQGSNFNLSIKVYTHGVVIRFRSSEAFKIFMGSSEYKDMWRSKFQPIIHKVLSINFLVDPVSLCNTASLIPRIQKEVILGPPWLVCSLKTSLRAPVVEVVELPAQKAPKNYAAITTEKKGKAVEGVREEPIDPAAEKHCQQRSSLLHPRKLQVSAPSSHSRSTGQRKFLLETVRSGVATSTFEHLGEDGQDKINEDAPENNPQYTTVYVGNLAPEA